MSCVHDGNGQVILVSDLSLLRPPTAFDGFDALIDGPVSNNLTALEVSYHVPGETKRLRDGTEYVVDANGAWRRTSK